MRVLLSGSITLLLLLAACSRYPYAGAVSYGVFVPMELKPVVEADSSAFYKTNVSIYGKTLSGILGIKNKRDSMLVTFFSEMGLKYFDIVLLKDTFRVVDCIPRLKSNAVIQTIVADLKTTFLFEKDQYKNPTAFLLNDTIITLFSYKNDWIFAEQFSDNTLKKLAYDTYKKKHKLKYIVSYSDYVNNYAQHISIKHSNIKLSIDLTRFNIH